MPLSKARSLESLNWRCNRRRSAVSLSLNSLMTWEAIEYEYCVGQRDLDGRDVGRRHAPAATASITAPLRRSLFQKGRSDSPPPSIADEDHMARVEIQDDGHVFVALAHGNFVDRDMLDVLQARLVVIGVSNVPSQCRGSCPSETPR